MCSSLNGTVPGHAPQMKQQFPCTISAMKRLQLKKITRSSLLRMEPSSIFLNTGVAPSVLARDVIITAFAESCFPTSGHHTLSGTGRLLPFPLLISILQAAWRESSDGPAPSPPAPTPSHTKHAPPESSRV